ncbi:MAG: hypothetical protein H0X29_07125 [Parachlamydiaceae bacterium]|nr:hypothetical protein [Parachlamydiaceae bacterium]
MSVLAINDRKLFEASESIFYQAQMCTEETIDQLTSTIAQAFFEKTLSEPEERKLFCKSIFEKISSKNLITPLIILQSPFYQSMQVKRTIPSDIHKIVLNIIVPSKRKSIQDVRHKELTFQEEKAINQWYAQFLECYMSDEDIVEESKTLSTEVKGQPKVTILELDDMLFKIKKIINVDLTNEFTEEKFNGLISEIENINYDNLSQDFKNLPLDSNADKKFVFYCKEFFYCFYKEYASIGMLDSQKQEIIDELKNVFNSRFQPKKFITKKQIEDKLSYIKKILNYSFSTKELTEKELNDLISKISNISYANLNYIKKHSIHSDFVTKSFFSFENLFNTYEDLFNTYRNKYESLDMFNTLKEGIITDLNVVFRRNFHDVEKKLIDPNG